VRPDKHAATKGHHVNLRRWRITNGPSTEEDFRAELERCISRQAATGSASQHPYIPDVESPLRHHSGDLVLPGSSPQALRAEVTTITPTRPSLMFGPRLTPSTGNSLPIDSPCHQGPVLGDRQFSGAFTLDMGGMSPSGLDSDSDSLPDTHEYRGMCTIFGF
jgi:hypothetical protein